MSADTTTPEAEARLHALARTMPRTYAAALGEALSLLAEARRERDALRDTVYDAVAEAIGDLGAPAPWRACADWAYWSVIVELERVFGEDPAHSRERRATHHEALKRYLVGAAEAEALRAELAILRPVAAAGAGVCAGGRCGMSPLTLIRAFRGVRGYYLRRIVERPHGALSAEVVRWPTTTLGWAHYDAGGVLRLEAFAPRPMPLAVVRGLQRVRRAD